MTQVGIILDKIFKTPLEGKLNLNIEKVIKFVFEELKTCISSQTGNNCWSMSDKKEWSELRTKLSLDLPKKSNFPTTSESCYDIKSSE
jgi:hypothetical protein